MATSIARWLLDEASSGTTPTTCSDDTGNGNTLTCNYNSGDASWTSIASGNGINIISTLTSTPGANFHLSDIVTNGNVGSSLDSTTTASCLIRVDNLAGYSSGGRVFFIGIEAGNGDFAVNATATELAVRWNQELTGGEVFYTLPVGLTTIVVNIDTTEATAADRCKVYYNDVLQTANSGTIPLNTALTGVNATSRGVAIGNRPANNRPSNGDFYYVELFDSVLTASEITSSHAGLSSDNDAIWDNNKTLSASAGSITITGGSATLGAPSVSEGATTWFNSNWWPDPTFGTTWWGSADDFVLTVDAGSITITGGSATLTESTIEIELLAEAGTVTLTGGGAKLSVPLPAGAGTISITGGSATFQIEYSSEEFIISNSSTFNGKGITLGKDIAYNNSTGIGYTILSRVDIDSLLLDGIFGTPPQPYNIQKYLTDATVKTMITVEFNGTEWVVVSTTTLGL